MVKPQTYDDYLQFAQSVQFYLTDLKLPLCYDNAI